MDTQILLDAEKIAQRQASFSSERIADSSQEPDVVNRWLSEICIRWKQMADKPSSDNAHDNNKNNQLFNIWSDEDYYRFVVGITRYLAFRDALILTSMADISEDKLVAFLKHPISESSTVLVHDILSGLLNEATAKPNMVRLNRCMGALSAIRERCPREYQTPFYAIEAYLWWTAGEFTQSRLSNSQALSLDSHYSLALITDKALSMKIYPAWCALSKHKRVSKQNQSTQQRE
ncbi:hypothetical protein [Alloscardovia omnicolens]|uniref:hypothetical protein n=1 Tax=Alloscardovia omnicolens TaxID=419015 RepID=UPI003A66F7DB